MKRSSVLVLFALKNEYINITLHLSTFILLLKLLPVMLLSFNQQQRYFSTILKTNLQCEK